MQLHDLIAQHGDDAFPHTEATFAVLRDLFHAKREAEHQVTATLASAMLRDPGFAYNFARLCCAESMPLGSGEEIDITARIQAFNPFKVISVMGALETDEIVFGEEPALLEAYRAATNQAIAKARGLVESGGAGERARDTGTLMIYGEYFPRLLFANLVGGDAALAVLSAAPETMDAVAEQRCGFSLRELAELVAARYELPRLNNPLYSGELRQAVRAALAACARRGAGSDGAESAA